MSENDQDNLKQPSKKELTKARIDPHISDILLGPVESYVKALQVTDDPEKIRSICSGLVRLGFIRGVIITGSNPDVVPGIFEAHQDENHQ